MLKSQITIKNLSFVIFISGIIYQLFNFSAPFVDEALYINAGKRIQNGMYLYDGYSNWFNGSPFIWPLLSSIIHEYFGLLGSRILASIFTFIGLIYFWKLTNHLFNKSIADWSLLLLSSNFYVISFAFIAVYDSMALCFFIVGYYFFQFEKPKTSALLVSLAIFIKYAMIGMLPILIIQSFITKRYRNLIHVLLFLGWLTIPYFYFVRGGFLSSYGVPDWSPERGAILIMIINFLKDSLILCLAGFITVFMSKKYKNYAIFFMISLLMWPAFHVLFKNNTSAHKHIVYGLFIAFPLVGIFFNKIAIKKKIFAGLLFVVVFSYQVFLLQNVNKLWPNFNKGFDYLTEHYKNNEVIFSTKPEHVQHHLKLLKIKSCDFIMNEWCLEKKKKNICSTDWVVINRYDWDNQKDRVETILKCGFKLQNTTESYVTVVKDIFSFTKRTHRLEIYKKSK